MVIIHFQKNAVWINKSWNNFGTLSPCDLNLIGIAKQQALRYYEFKIQEQNCLNPTHRPWKTKTEIIISSFIYRC